MAQRHQIQQLTSFAARTPRCAGWSCCCCCCCCCWSWIWHCWHRNLRFLGTVMVIVAQFYTFVPGTTTTTTTFWLRLPITLQATQFRATAIRSQMNMKGVCFHKKNSYLKLKYWSFIWWNSVLLLPISIAIFLWFKRKHKFVKVKEKLSNWGLGWTICKRHHSFTKWQSVSILFSNIMKWEKVKVKRYARKPLKSYVIMICNVKSLIGTYSKVNISNTNIQYQDCSQMSQFPFFFFNFGRRTRSRK